MNVLLFSQFFSTTKGGGEYVFKSIAKVLSENGHRVWVVTNDVKNESYEESENLRIVRVRPHLEYAGGIPPSFFDNIKYSINALFAGYKIAKKEKIDIIHSNNFAPVLAGSFLSMLARIPHITTIHDVFSTYGKEFWTEWTKQSGVSRINARLVPFFEKLMIRLKAECIHTVSEATKRDILQLGAKKPVRVIPNCILHKEPTTAKTNPRQFVFIGRLVFYKNVQVLIRAASIVSKEFPDFKIVVAGDGPYRNTLEKLAEDMDVSESIEFRGYVTPKEKEKILAESNALLFPSKIEGFGLVMLEAFQQKKPVIASDIPPMSEIIQDGKNGFLLDADNEKLWAEKIKIMIKDYGMSQSMGKAAHEILGKKYGTRSFYENMIKMYEGVLRNELG